MDERFRHEITKILITIRIHLKLSYNDEAPASTFLMLAAFGTVTVH